MEDYTQFRGASAENTLCFLQRLFLPYGGAPAARVELRCFAPANRSPRPGGGVAPRGWYPLTPEGLGRAAQDARRWAPAWEVYCGVLPRRDRGGGAQDLRCCAFLWCDIDGGEESPREALALVKSAVDAGTVPRPCLLVVSGGGVHAYWQLAEVVPCKTPEEQDRLRRTLRRVVLAIGGEVPRAHADRASAEPARILRVAGTFNHKIEGHSRPVRLLRVDTAQTVDVVSTGASAASLWPLVKWCAHLPPEPLPPIRTRPVAGQGTSSFRSAASPPPAILVKLTAGAPNGQKHYAMRNVAVWGRKEGLDEAVLRSYVEQVGVASGVPMNDPDQQRHVDALMAWAQDRVTPDYSRMTRVAGPSGGQA